MILKFEPNAIVEIALKFPEGKLVEGRYGDQTMFTLAKPPDTVMYLDNDVAAKLNLLDPQVRETIYACKRWTGQRKDKPVWDFWRPEAQPRPKAEASVTAPAPVSATITQPVSASEGGSSNGSSTNGSNGNGHTNGNGHLPGWHDERPPLPAERPKTKLEDALKTVVSAIHATRSYAKEIGYDMPTFNGDELVRMVNTLMIQSGNGGTR